VTEDKAIHSLIESGMDWMEPLLTFRNKLHESTIPENKTKYRNFKRRTGKVSYMRAKDISDDTNVELKHIPGPYLMMWRKIWLKELLQIQKDMNEAGHEIDLVRDEELQAIRQQWLRDPNEPDWPDSLPQLYSEVYPDTDFDWIENDAGVFTEHDTELLESLGEEHGVPAQLLMKLLEVEISAGGLGQRRGILNKLESVLRKDWDSLEEIKERKAETSEFDNWKDKLDELQQQYDGAAHL
jgi:DNA sulfur modification protein DndC